MPDRVVVETGEEKVASAVAVFDDGTEGYFPVGSVVTFDLSNDQVAHLRPPEGGLTTAAVEVPVQSVGQVVEVGVYAANVTGAGGETTLDAMVTLPNGTRVNAGTPLVMEVKSPPQVADVKLSWKS